MSGYRGYYKESKHHEYEEERLPSTRMPKEMTIKDLEIGTTLGTGTFGRVRQAYLKKDPKKKIYALKMLKKTSILKLSQLEHIKSEKLVLSKYNHSFIVKLYKLSILTL